MEDDPKRSSDIFNNSVQEVSNPKMEGYEDQIRV
jgi:hypothetical protein